MALENSYQNAVKRFALKRVANKYPTVYRNNKHDQREKLALLKSISLFKKNTHILDCPCGTGRLTRILLDEGFNQVTIADSATVMIDLAKKNLIEYQIKKPHLQLKYKVTDVMQTGFADKSFDGIICNRLFHHFFEPEYRLKALKELARISRGYIVISFFNSASFSAKFRLVKKFIRGKKPRDRVPISMDLFLSEIAQQGLQLVKDIPVYKGISPMHYVILKVI